MCQLVRTDTNEFILAWSFFFFFLSSFATSFQTFSSAAFPYKGQALVEATAGNPPPSPTPRQQLQQMPASQLPQWLFGFAGLIPDGFGSRVIRLSPKGQRACQVSPHINVVLLTPWADSTARQRGREEHWSAVVGGVWTLGWTETLLFPYLNRKKKKKSSEKRFSLGIYNLRPRYGVQTCLVIVEDFETKWLLTVVSRAWDET